jgi:hypothetical protein
MREKESNRRHRKEEKRKRERKRKRKKNLMVVCAGREGGKRDVDCPIKECLEREKETHRKKKMKKR